MRKNLVLFTVLVLEKEKHLQKNHKYSKERLIKGRFLNYFRFKTSFAVFSRHLKWLIKAS